MTKYLPIAEARQKLLELPDQILDEPVIITQEGKPVIAAMSYEQFESLIETLDILSDATFAQKLQTSITQAEMGESISWEDAKLQLGL